MSRLISLHSLTRDTIIHEVYKEELRELYALRNIIESQAWHDNQGVFDHSLKSMEALSDILSFDFLGTNAKRSLSNYLDARLDMHSKKELLQFATLLHDIGKNISLQKNKAGNTSSPSHGIIGGWVAAPLLERFELTGKERTYILRLITSHLLPSDLIELEINGALKTHESLQLLAQHEPEYIIELLLLAYSDWMGCVLRADAQDECQKRIALVKSLLESIGTTMPSITSTR